MLLFFHSLHFIWVWFIERVKEKVEAGYQNLHQRIATLDYDAEQAAEEELVTMDIAQSGGSFAESSSSQMNLMNPDLFNP